MILTNLNILVTGGCGFIGGHLVDDLIYRDNRVSVLDDFSTGHYKHPRARYYKASVTSKTHNFVELVKPDVVFHLACRGVRHSIGQPEANADVNSIGTLRILEQCVRADPPIKRFIYVSSSEVYGHATTFPLTVDTATWPSTVYGASKLAGEHYASAYHRCYGLPTVRVRPFNCYGPRAHWELDSGEVIPRMMLRVLAGKSIIVYGDGQQTRDYLYISDLVAGLVRAAEVDALVGDVVNVGAGVETTIAALAMTICLSAGYKGIEFQPARPGDVLRLWVDTSKFCAITGWKPQVSLATGLRETFDWYRELYRKDPKVVKLIQERNW